MNPTKLYSGDMPTPSRESKQLLIEKAIERVNEQIMLLRGTVDIISNGDNVKAEVVLPGGNKPMAIPNHPRSVATQINELPSDMDKFCSELAEIRKNIEGLLF